MNVHSIPQRIRSLLLVAIAIVTLGIAAVSYVGIDADGVESVNRDSGSLHLAGPVNDDGGGN